MSSMRNKGVCYEQTSLEEWIDKLVKPIFDKALKENGKYNKNRQ